MQIGVIGLGRMGGNIVRRLSRAGHTCVVYDANAATAQELRKRGRDAGRVGRRSGEQARPRAAHRVGDAAGGQDHRSHGQANSVAC